jgi:ubiquinone/menaquinone biosynthesis C-methylase UbiE
LTVLLPCWLIKFGFHLLYYQLAWTYDLVAWSVSFGQWAAWRRLALPFLRPGPTLELAYGTGAFFVEMVEAGYNPVGIDLSPYMARLAAQRLRRKNYYYALCLSRAKAQALPFPANHFANVVATFPTDYMLSGDTIVEVHRVLQSSAEDGQAGRLVVVFEGQLRGPWPLRSLVDWLYEITAQRTLPPTRPLRLLNVTGFAARWEIVEQQDALARLLIAEKQDALARLLIAEKQG